MTQLNKQFSERDVQRMRNIITGNTVDNTRTHNLLEKLIKATEAGGNVIMGATAVGHVGAMNTFSI